MKSVWSCLTFFNTRIEVTYSITCVEYYVCVFYEEHIIHNRHINNSVEIITQLNVYSSCLAPETKKFWASSSHRSFCISKITSSQIKPFHLVSIQLYTITIQSWEVTLTLFLFELFALILGQFKYPFSILRQNNDFNRTTNFNCVIH